MDRIFGKGRVTSIAIQNRFRGRSGNITEMADTSSEGSIENLVTMHHPYWLWKAV